MNLFLLSFLGAVIVFIVLTIFNVPLNESAAFYILSSISQGLSALLALVFTTILIIVQVFKRFKAWQVAMSLQSIIVITCYFIGIILPLIVLRVGANGLLVNIAISWTVLCVIILFPLISRIGQLMTGTVVLGELQETIIDAVNKKSWGKVISDTHDFQYIWISKIKHRELLEFDAVLNMWRSIKNYIPKPYTYEVLLNTIINVCYALVKLDIQDVHKKQVEDHAINVYNSFRVHTTYTDPIPMHLINLHIQHSINILSIAIKKSYDDFSFEIIGVLSMLIWEAWSRAGPVPNRDNDAIVILKQILKVNRRYIENAIEDERMITKLGNEREKHKVLLELLNKIKSGEKGEKV